MAAVTNHTVRARAAVADAVARLPAAAAAAAAASAATTAATASQLESVSASLRAKVAAAAAWRARCAAPTAPLPATSLSATTRAALAAALTAATDAAAAVVRSSTAALPLPWRAVTPEQCAAACNDLLASVVRTPFTTYTRERLFTVELAPPYPGAPPLVLLHGYGSGAGLWAFVLDDLAAHYHVYAVDWLGCGASARPPFTPTTVAAGEAWFTESLEAWRRASQLEAPVIAGHSLGGYLAAAYALHHPRHVAHLALVSPAGIPAPPDTDALAARRGSWLLGMVAWAWENNVTPQAIVRALGTWGEKWASNLIAQRFQSMLDAHAARYATLDRAALVKYLYQITAADGSGEFALNVLLAFGAHAREPMGPRLLAAATMGEVPEPSDADAAAGGRAGRAGGPPRAVPHRFATPTTLLYGGGWDWMPATAGIELAADLREAGVDATAALVPQAGHNLFVEQPVAFARELLRQLANRRAVIQ